MIREGFIAAGVSLPAGTRARTPHFPGVSLQRSCLRQNVYWSIEVPGISASDTLSGLDGDEHGERCCGQKVSVSPGIETEGLTEFKLRKCGVAVGGLLNPFQVAGPAVQR